MHVCKRGIFLMQVSFLIRFLLLLTDNKRERKEFFEFLL